jgi:hypothetical protein
MIGTWGRSALVSALFLVTVALAGTAYAVTSSDSFTGLDEPTDEPTRTTLTTPGEDAPSTTETTGDKTEGNTSEGPGAEPTDYDARDSTTEDKDESTGDATGASTSAEPTHTETDLGGASTDEPAPADSTSDSGTAKTAATTGGPRVLAHVNWTGELVNPSYQAVGITNANIVHKGVGLYCIHDLGFAPRNVVATVRGDAARTIAVSDGPASGCPAGTDVVVETAYGDGHRDTPFFLQIH